MSEQELKRPRGKYFLITGDVVEFETKGDLQKHLKTTELSDEKMIIHGRKKDIEVKQKTYVSIN